MGQITRNLKAGEKRRFIRHPFAIPIECISEGRLVSSDSELSDISHGGMAFFSGTGHAPGELLDIRFPAVNDKSFVRGEVVWCRKDHDSPGRYVIGLKFLDEKSHFQARMFEQICHIENYRNEQAQKGRSISEQEAATEWIDLFADRFPF